MGIFVNFLFFLVGAKFLTLGIGAREISMGSIGSVFVRDANATYFNPALLSMQDMGNFMASHCNYLLDMRLESFSLSHPFGKIHTGLNFYGFFVSELEGRTGPSETFSLFGASFLNTNFSIASFLYRNLSLGLTIKNVYEKIDTFSSSSFAFDFGFVYKPEISFFEIGGVLSNFGSKLKLKSENYELPSSLRLGAGFYFKDLKFALEVFKILKENTEFHTGFEYLIKDILFLRMGYKTGYKDAYSLAGLTFGFGLKYSGFNFDYAFEPYGDFGNIHRLSFGMNFKPLKIKFPEKKKEPIIEPKPEPEKIVVKEVKPLYPFNLDSLYLKAVKEYENKNFISSYKFFMEIIYIDKTFKNSYNYFVEIKGNLLKNKIELAISEYDKNLTASNYLDAYSVIKNSYETLEKPEILGHKLKEIEEIILRKTQIKEEREFLFNALKFYTDKRYRDAINEFRKIKKNEIISDWIKKCEEKRERKIKSLERDLDFYIKNENYEKAYDAIQELENEGYISSQLMVTKTRIENKLKEKSKILYEQAINMEKNKKLVEALLLVSKSVKTYPLEESKLLESRIIENFKGNFKLYEELMIYSIKLFHQGNNEDALILWEKAENINPSDERISYVKIFRNL
ncbi:MAG: PorV/PorQ family protein [candidate division WOR-3 bacterium]